MKKKPKAGDVLLGLLLLILTATGLYLHCSLPAAASAAMEHALLDSRQTIPLPILMYHSITEDSGKTGEYVITASALEEDLKWLRDHGYTTVSARQLTDYGIHGAALPEKPVLLTFDDGYQNNYTLAFPLLEKYNAKAVISLIGSESDRSSDTIYRGDGGSGGNVTWGEAAIMDGSGLVEIGNHTYDLHRNTGPRKGADKIPGESDRDYRQVLRKDLGHNQDLIAAAVGEPALLFAWPFGAWPSDGSADALLKELGFTVSVTSYQTMNTIRREDADSLFGLRRFLRTPDFRLEEHLPE